MGCVSGDMRAGDSQISKSASCKNSSLSKDPASGDVVYEMIKKKPSCIFFGRI